MQPLCLARFLRAVRHQPVTGSGRTELPAASLLYRAREHRAFRNDAVCQAGRVVHAAHSRRTVKNKSRFGREAQQRLRINRDGRRCGSSTPSAPTCPSRSCAPTG